MMEVSNRPMSQFQNALEMRYVSLRYDETKAILVLVFNAFSELCILRPDTKTKEVSNRPMTQF
jgi:hypothetical protein